MVASMTYGSVRIARRMAALAALSVLALAGSGCSKLKARDLLNKGVAAFKNGQSDSAIEDFKQAKEADPDLLNARLYKDPNNLSAIDGIGSILFQMGGQPFDPKRFEESKSYHQRHIQLKPEDPEPYYWIGVIDWTLAFRANGEMRMDYNRNNIKKQVRDTDPLPAAIRSEYASKYGPLIDEGIADLQKAISIKPDYDDAMAYLNLLYRRKADMVESKEEREALLKQADDLVDKVKEIKQKRSEQPQAT